MSTLNSCGLRYCLCRNEDAPTGEHLMPGSGARPPSRQCIAALEWCEASEGDYDDVAGGMSQSEPKKMIKTNRKNMNERAEGGGGIEVETK